MFRPMPTMAINGATVKPQVKGKLISVIEEADVKQKDIILIQAEAVSDELADGLRESCQGRDNIAFAVYGDEQDQARVKLRGLEIVDRPASARSLTVISAGITMPKIYEGITTLVKYINLQDGANSAAAILIAIFTDDIRTFIAKFGDTVGISDSEKEALYARFENDATGITIKPVNTDDEEKLNKIISIVQQST